MTKERVIWTALPKGWNEDGRLVLSVFVSPRLSNADNSDTIRELGEFPAFANWPERLGGMKFLLEFDNGLVTEGVVKQELDPELWGLVFPLQTPVRPYEFERHARRYIHTYPVRDIHQYLKNVYGTLGAGGDQVPSIDDPTGPLSLFDPLQNITTYIASKRYNSSYYDELGRAGQSDDGEEGQVVSEELPMAGLTPAQHRVQKNFFQAYRFYTRPGSSRPLLGERYIEPPPRVPEFDFHQIVAFLGDHPQLLRKLGLVIDLVVDVSDPLGELSQDGWVRVIPEGEVPDEPPVTPATFYLLDEEMWVAKPKNDFILWRGLLRLNLEFFELFQVDVDGAVMQTTGFADTLRRLRNPERRGPEASPEETAPALRSGGMTLARINRGHELLDHFKDQAQKNVDFELGVDVKLFAEDLLRGYRVDVWDEDARDGPRWFSLHQRVSSHAVDPGDGQPVALPDIEDEGYIKATAVSGERKDHPVPPSDDLYLHEAVFGWQGWSLSAPFPGKRIVEPGEGENRSTVAPFDPQHEDNPTPLTTSIAVAGGTLPRLRIGHTYRMRARTVDLAGNSRPFSPEDLEPDQPDLASEAEGFLRFDPLPSPVVLRRHLDTEGESLEHLVIRSNLGQTAQQYATSKDVNDALQEAGAPHTYAEDSQRHVSAPKGSQQMAEQHGFFDDAFDGGAAEINAALRISLREEGTYLDETIVDLNTGQKTINQTTISTFPDNSPLPPNRGDGLDPGAYSFYPDDHVILPFLPDPLAIGVSITAFDFTGAKVFQRVIEFSGEWPVLEPIRLRLSEGPEGVDFLDGVLEVRLPRARELRARFASLMREEHLDDMAIWEWMSDGDKTESMKELIRAGRHWMFTPFRELIFTHAVQQPLLVPNMTKVTWGRVKGDTYATAYGKIGNHAQSTGRLDVYAQWTEDTDLISEDLPRMRALGTAVPYETHAFGFDIKPGEDQAKVTDLIIDNRLSRHEFGDTKHRRILYHSVATTRFREFLPPPIAADMPRIQRVEETHDEEGKEKIGLLQHINSSARPAAPAVKYVLPTFRWEKDDEGDVRRHVRRGKGVRVWLDRPWFSSGDDEQLAVILEPGGKLPPGWVRFDEDLELTAVELARRPPIIRREPLLRGSSPRLDLEADVAENAAAFSAGELGFTDAIRAVDFTADLIGALIPPRPPGEVKELLQPFVTNWGSDPVWESRAIDARPTIAAFPGHVGYATGLTLDELPKDIRVVAVAHEVHFDADDRKLWYCDIEIDPGDTYYPFVRLGLARYQPYSVYDVHLSQVTMTDFIQLAPDRTAELEWIDDLNVALKVEGWSGRNIVSDKMDYLSPWGFEAKGPNTVVKATLQRSNPDIPGDMGWERVGDDVLLSPKKAGFHVTWVGKMDLSATDKKSLYRILLTEIESYDGDYEAGVDPPYSITPHDRQRERIVFADIFELQPRRRRPREL
jgi:hypothetical protein